jgi:hypothetical protein
MAGATPNLATTRLSINQGWLIRVEALRLAKIAVKEDIRAKGQRLKDYEAKEITLLAQRWLSEHRASLIGQATIGLLCSNLTTNAQKQKAQSTGLSAVQKSGAK